MMDKKLIKMLEDCKVVSFDVFDTLILRHVKSPADIFDLIEDQYNKTHANNVIKEFRKQRINAERKARKNKNGHEVTLNEIYTYLPKYISSTQLVELQQLEIQTEYEVCYRNKEMFRIYKWALDHNKKVVITSDMYLDQQTIEKILHKAGYIHYDQLFISSAIGLRKKDGELFKYLINKIGIRPMNVLHVGDNRNSDYDMPRQNGLQAWQYIRCNVGEIFQDQSCCSKVLEGYLSSYPISNYYRAIGIHVLGPLLYGFVNWLHEAVDTKRPDRILFLARDGNIMKKAYEALYGNEGTEYVYGSRRALIVPTLWKNCTIDNIQKSIHFHDRITIEDVFQRIGLVADEYKSQIGKCGLTVNTRVDGLHLENDCRFVELFNLVKDDLYTNSIKEYDGAIKYWKSVLSESKKVFLVDIGWNGNMQNALLKLLCTDEEMPEIYGYYLGVNPDTNYSFPMYGYLCDQKHMNDIYAKIQNFSGVLESMFMTDHGSTNRYISEPPYYRLYPNEFDSDQGKIVDEKIAIKEIQEGAIEFIVGFSHSKYVKNLTADKDFYANLFALGLAPSLKAAEKLGDFRFYNSGISYLARLKEGRFNVCELANTNWRIGYLKRCFKVNINYYLAAKMIKKLKGLIW